MKNMAGRMTNTVIMRATEGRKKGDENDDEILMDSAATAPQANQGPTCGGTRLEAAYFANPSCFCFPLNEN
jgi:hypothetical protein